MKNIGPIVNKFFIVLLIYKKWLRDKSILPLTIAHWNLYQTIHLFCYKELNKFPNLIDCITFSDKIQWLKLFDQRIETIRCSDKILVRNYVKERIGEKYLTVIYQTANAFSDLNFNNLPNSYVIKTNNDSGTNILVHEKDKLNILAAETLISRSLKRPYGRENGEWPYSYIFPRVYIEEMINTNIGIVPPDYKFHCVNSKVKFVQYVMSRNKNPKEVIIDRDGAVMDAHINSENQLANSFEKPKNWKLMINLAENLSTKWKYVRIDFYNYNGTIYFGEMTFFPLRGIIKEGSQKAIGELLNFNRNTFKKFLIPILEKKIGYHSLYPSSHRKT